MGIDHHAYPAGPVPLSMPVEPAGLELPFQPTGMVTAPGWRWYCVHTGPGHEILALQELRALALPDGRRLAAWLPEHAAPARATGELRIKALFPRYLFVQANRAAGHLGPIHRARGVEAILGYTPDEPTPVPLAALHALWRQCAPNGVIYPPAPPVRLPRVAPGAAVRVATGPFAGLSGICRWSSAERVAVLIQILGGERELRITRRDVVVT